VLKMLWQNKFLCCNALLLLSDGNSDSADFQINLLSSKDEPYLCVSYLCRIAAAKLCGSLFKLISCLL